MAQSSVANIKVEPMIVYWDGKDLGFTDGDLSLSTEKTMTDVTAHQRGTQLLDGIITGTNVELTVTLKETSAAQVEDMVLAGTSKQVALAEVTEVTCVDDLAGSLDAKYFTLNSAKDVVKYYVWANVDASSVDPAPIGLTGIEYAVTSGDAASVVAASMGAAVAAEADFGTSIIGAVVTITNAVIGGTTDSVDVNSGFTICVTQDGTIAAAGLGTDQQFLNISAFSKLLRLHPVVLDDSDESRDVSCPLAYPLLNSITYSGENPETMEISFKILPKESAGGGVQLIKFGEGK